MKQNRFRSPVFWGAVVAQIISIGQFTGIWNKYGIDTGMIGDVVAGILQLAVLVGLLNNPTNPNGL
ncbi:MAG TPA: phage holin [Ruminiclostridium sp.]